MSTSCPRGAPPCATGAAAGAAGATEGVALALSVCPQVPQNLKLRLFDVLHFGQMTWSLPACVGLVAKGPLNAAMPGEEPPAIGALGGVTGIGGAAMGGAAIGGAAIGGICGGATGGAAIGGICGGGAAIGGICGGAMRPAGGVGAVKLLGA